MEFSIAAVRRRLLGRGNKVKRFSPAIFYCLTWALAAASASPQRGLTPPNFVIIFVDDLGYNDVSSYGARHIKTPNIDRMAQAGLKLTSFYAQNVCGPSRAALMTGSYPIRIGEPGNTKNAHTIPHPQEVTIAEVLKTQGYSTGLIGKWHLAGGGRNERGRGTGPYRADLMPNNQGFDYFFGTPSHNGVTREVEAEGHMTELMRNDEVLESPTDMDQLTRRYTQEALRFIERNREQPFFLYLAHNMPHVPLGASKTFRGRSPRGLYGDVVEELDWSVGEVLTRLKDVGLDGTTLVFFTSDNGPWIEDHLGDYGGSADPLRGFKMSTWEGGIRVPGIAWWPARIPGGRISDSIVSTLDLLPTLAGLAGAALPQDRVIDGKNVWPLLSAESKESPRESFFYYAYTHLQAVRLGRWKLVLDRPDNPPWTSWYGRMIDAVEKPQLYDLELDISESRNVAEQNPAIVEDLLQLADKAREELGDYDRIGTEARFFDEGRHRPNMNAWK